MISVLRSRTGAVLSGIAAALTLGSPAAADPLPADAPSPAEVRAAVSAAGSPGMLAGVGGLGTIVVTGDAHTCAATLAGDVWCWGSGRLTPVPISNGAPLVGDAVIGLAAGRAHTCAIAESDEGTVFCWGTNGSGQLGDGSTTDRSRPVRVLDGVTAITAGRDHTCALAADTTVWCWGDDTDGQLGLGGAGGRQETPRRVPGLTGVTGLSAGAASTCAVGDDGRAWCWGSDAAGQLGDGAANSGGGTPVAVAPPAGVRFLQVSVGRAHACGVSDASAVYCWGSGRAGGDADRPRPVAGLSFAVAVTAGGDSTCATLVGGPPSCWGAGDRGVLGVGDTAGRDRPAAVARGSLVGSSFVRAVFGWDEPLVVQLALGGRHACAVDGDSVVHCWGAGDAGQLGTGGIADALVPVATRLAPAPVTGVRVEARDGALRVAWAPGGDPGAAPIEEYAAFAVRPPGDLALCTAETDTGCTVDGLTGGTRYAVFVGVRSATGLSYSALTYAAPTAGQGAGLPVTGPPALAGLVLVLAGALVIRCSRSRRRPAPGTGSAPAARPSARPAR